MPYCLPKIYMGRICFYSQCWKQWSTSDAITVGWGCRPQKELTCRFSWNITPATNVTTVKVVQRAKYELKYNQSNIYKLNHITIITTTITKPKLPLLNAERILRKKKKHFLLLTCLKKKGLMKHFSEKYWLTQRENWNNNMVLWKLNLQICFHAFCHLGEIGWVRSIMVANSHDTLPQ